MYGVTKGRWIHLFGYLLVIGDPNIRKKSKTGAYIEHILLMCFVTNVFCILSFVPQCAMCTCKHILTLCNGSEAFGHNIVFQSYGHGPYCFVIYFKIMCICSLQCPATTKYCLFRVIGHIGHQVTMFCLIRICIFVLSIMVSSLVNQELAVRFDEMW